MSSAAGCIVLAVTLLYNNTLKHLTHTRCCQDKQTHTQTYKHTHSTCPKHTLSAVNINAQTQPVKEPIIDGLQEERICFSETLTCREESPTLSWNEHGPRMHSHYVRGLSYKHKTITYKHIIKVIKHSLI